MRVVYLLKKTEIVYGRNDGVLHKTPSFRLWTNYIAYIRPAGLRFTKIRKKREILVRFEKKDGKSHIKQVKNRWKCCTIKDKPKNGRRLKKETRKDEK